MMKHGVVDRETYERGIAQLRKEEQNLRGDVVIATTRMNTALETGYAAGTLSELQAATLTRAAQRG
jgi:hypothetical protein